MFGGPCHGRLWGVSVDLVDLLVDSAGCGEGGDRDRQGMGLGIYEMVHRVIERSSVYNIDRH